jgi:mannitol-1-phosphate 5-dehydrogenase
MLESALALSKKYGASLFDLQMHITDLLNRFTNAALGDTCQRVGGDPARKLSPADRLIGSATLALEQGITPAYITVGAAAGLRRYLMENGQEQTVENAGKVLEEVSELSLDAPLALLIMQRYQELCDGATIGQLCQKADAIKGASLSQVV